MPDQDKTAILTEDGSMAESDAIPYQEEDTGFDGDSVIEAGSSEEAGTAFHEESAEENSAVLTTESSEGTPAISEEGSLEETGTFSDEGSLDGGSAVSDEDSSEEGIAASEEESSAEEAARKPAKAGQNESGRTRRKKKRYQGYDVENITSRRYKKSKPWFWKVLFISLILTAIIVVAACTYFINGDRKKTDYLAGMNEANNMQALLEGHKNVSITESFSHLVDDKDYTLTRIVTKTKSGEYYSYLKKIQDEDTNKEVIRNKVMYRYDESFPRYVALVGDNYEKICVPEIEGCVFQNDGNETIEDEKDKGELVNIKASVVVQEGDEYNTIYGFDPGTKIDKTIVMDKESGIVTSETEKSGDEEFYSYLVEHDGETKVPYFYKKIKEKTDTRECTVYVDDGTGEWKEYNFDVPTDVYFTVLEQEGYRCYTDEDCTKEFSEYQISVQNPESSVTLYLKKVSDQGSEKKDSEEESQ